MRLLAHVYLDWDSTEHYNKALSAADLANAVSKLVIILTECTSYDQTRHQYYSFTDIKYIFSHTPSQSVLNFVSKSIYMISYNF